MWHDKLETSFVSTCKGPWALDEAVVIVMGQPDESPPVKQLGGLSFYINYFHIVDREKKVRIK